MPLCLPLAGTAWRASPAARTLAGLAALVALAGPARADWGERYRTGDVDGVRREAAAGGAAAVERNLGAGDRATVVAAIAVADQASDAWRLLGPLAELAGGWDRSTAAPAAAAAARIARDFDGDRAVLVDAPDDRLATFEGAWTRLARAEHRWSDVRVHALAVATALGRARTATADAPPAVDAALAGWVGDDDPEVARAALELMTVPAPPEVRAALGQRVRTDGRAVVRAAAAATLCAALPDDAAAVAAALGPEGAAAVRALADDPPDLPGAMIDLARCLAIDPAPAARTSLGRLRQAAPRRLRPAIARVAAHVRAEVRAGARR